MSGWRNIISSGWVGDGDFGVDEAESAVGH